MKQESDEFDFFRSLFESSPGRFLVVSAEDFEIVAASNAYLASTNTTRNNTIGRCIFDVFPDDPNEPAADGTLKLKASFLRVIETAATDRMSIQRYPIKIPENQGGGFEERYWAPENSPVFVKGQVRFIIHSVDDVTAQARLEQSRKDIEVLTRVAGKAAKLGSWRLDLIGKSLFWSEETFKIYGVSFDYRPSLQTALDFYVERYRDGIRNSVQACIEKGMPFDEVAQLRRANGEVVWVRAIGEAEYNDNGARIGVRGAIQDIDEFVTAQTIAMDAEHRLQETLENISDAFFTIDDEWKLTFLNQSAVDLFSLSKVEFDSEDISFIETIFFNSRLYKELEKVKDSHQLSRFSFFANEIERWFSVTAYPTQSGLAVYMRDSTNEMENEIELRLLKASVERLNDIILITEAEPISAPDGPKIIYVNEAFEKRTGYSKEEVIGKTPRILQGERTQQSELRRIGDALRNWEPVRAELINYKKNGEEFWLELDIVPLADDTGWFTHWVAVERDITDRKLTEVQLRASEERFAIAAQATNDVLWDWDFSANTIWWNDSYTELFGYERDDKGLSAESWLDHIHEDDFERVTTKIYACIEGSITHWNDEYRFVRADGTVATVMDRGIVVRDEHGKALRMIGSMTDVTERRLTDEHLRQSQKMEAVGQLTGGVAHDFNNLLTVILGNSELLHEKLAASPELQTFTAITVSAAERGAELTNRLLSFARRQPLEPIPTDVNQLIDDMRGLIESSLSEDFDVQLKLKQTLFVTETDPGQLESAILNLVINARDAMIDGGKLTIETSNEYLDEEYKSRYFEVKTGEYICITVSDTGCGMSNQVFERAFEPFFTTKEKGKGSGLGLSMVYGFVKQSGGYVRLYSEIDEGTSVKIYLPRSNSVATERVQRSETEIEGGIESILVVEDDELVREHVVNQLKGLGYAVTEANSAQNALAVLAEKMDFDLLFTDVVMPGGMNGPQLAEKVVEIIPSIKVLYTSGYTENAIVHRGRLDPGVSLLSKPYRRKQLAEKIRYVLDNI